MVLKRASLTFRTRQTITQEDSALPYVGFENDNDLPDGWLYDIKRWGSPFDLRIPALPKLSNPSYQGLNVSEYFKSGVGDKDLGDLKIQDILEYSINGTKSWIPLIKNGIYWRYNTDYFYYSDSSIVEYIDPNEDRSSRNYIELSKIPDNNAPILAASFIRDVDTKEIKYYKRIKQCYKFSGTYDSDYQENTTVSDAGKIYWSNVDTNKREFIVDNTIDGITRLFFNNNYIETIGAIPTSYADLQKCEYLGRTTSSSHKIQYDDSCIYLTAFYLKRFPVLLDNFHLYIATGSTYEEYTRVDSWWDMATNLNDKQYFVDKDLGIVYFSSQYTTYLPPANRDIAVTYQTTLRIEYNEQDQDETIRAEDANVNPITQSVNQGFVCITHENLDATGITLSINKPRILNSSDPILRGPINIGSDYGILTAAVTNINGIKLSNIPVTFTVDPNFGYLNGSETGLSITDKYGNAYATYQPPVSADDLGYYTTIAQNSTSPSYPTDREVVIGTTDNIGWSGNEDDVYIYQILKDDIILGYKTVDQFLWAMYQEETPAWVVDATTYSKWKEETTIKYDLQDFQSEPISSGKKINGRKVIIYQINGSDNYDASAINPVTGESGAVVPVKPLAIERNSGNLWRIIYPSGSIVDCGQSEDVAGYWLVSSKTIAFNAYCWSNFYNDYIYSNKIYVKITLPNYMKGEYITDLDKIIPFGWKLPSDTDNVSSALDGATFITINPFKGPYPIIDLVGGTGETGDWASAPFRTVGFQFNTSS